MGRSSLIRWAAILILSAGVSTAKADMIGFEWSGSIDAPGGTFNSPFGSISDGDPFRLRYVFDSATPDSFPAFNIFDPNIGEYLNTIQSFSLEIGTASLTGVPTSSFIQIRDEFQDDMESYHASMSHGPLQIDLLVRFVTGTLANDALPTTLDPDTFHDRNDIFWPYDYNPLFSLTDYDQEPDVGYVTATGQITSFHISATPVPSAALLGVLGLGMAGWLTRRRT